MAGIDGGGVALIDLGPFLGGGVCFADAIDSVLASVPAGTSPSAAVPTILIPEGRFPLRRPLDLKRRVHLLGAGPAGQATSDPCTIIEADPGIFPAAVVINRRNTTLAMTAPPTTEADGSVIENIMLKGPGAGATGGHGIWLRARAILRGVVTKDFPGDGVHIVATASAADPALVGNANLWSLQTVQSRTNGGNGIYVQGADVNNGTARDIDVVGNRKWGVRDGSFLGNSWNGHAAGNGQRCWYNGRRYYCVGEGASVGDEPGASERWLDGGPGVVHGTMFPEWSSVAEYWPGGGYTCTNYNARSIFFGCYAESDQAPSRIVRPSLVIGGAIAVTDDTPEIKAVIGAVRVSPAVEVLSTGDRALRTHVGAGVPNQFGQYTADGDHPSGLSWYWTEADGTYGLRHARVAARRALEITSDLTPAGRFGRPDPVLGGYPWLPRGVFIGHATHGRHLSMGNAMPTGGGADGDIVLNTGSGPLLWKREGGAWVEKWADGERPAE